MTDADQRLTELELRLAHHERMAEDLSAVLIEQQKTVDLLRLQVTHLRERIGLLERERTQQDDRPPPHY
jgi:SlyX protein